MRKAFGLALGKVQTAIAVSEDAIKKEPLEKEQAKELTEMIRSLASMILSFTSLRYAWTSTAVICLSICISSFFTIKRGICHEKPDLPGKQQE